MTGGMPEGWTAEQEAGWQALCEDVDTDVFVRGYVPAGGQRDFEQWSSRPLSQMELDCLSSRHPGSYAERFEPLPGPAA